MALTQMTWEEEEDAEEKEAPEVKGSDRMVEEVV